MKIKSFLYCGLCDNCVLSYVEQVELVINNLPANAGDTRDTGSIPESGRSPGVGNGTLLQHSCLENFMGRGAWLAIVHWTAKSWARLSD